MSHPESHAQIIEELLYEHRFNQTSLAKELTQWRQDGRTITQPSISRWLYQGIQVGMEEAICIEEITCGTDHPIRAVRFYPEWQRLGPAGPGAKVIARSRARDKERHKRMRHRAAA